MNFNTDAPNAILSINSAQSALFLRAYAFLLWQSFRFGYFSKGFRFSIGMTLQSFQKYSIIHNIDISLDVSKTNMNIWSKVSNTNMWMCFFPIFACQYFVHEGGNLCRWKREKDLSYYPGSIAVPAIITAGSFEFILRGRRDSNRNKFLTLFRHPTGVSTPAFYRVRICLVSRIRWVSSVENGLTRFFQLPDQEK